MISHVDIIIKNLDRKDKIINYLKTIYAIEVGHEAMIPNAYIEDHNKENKDKDNIINQNFFSFQEKVDSLYLPDNSDKTVKLKIAKLKKERDTKFLIKNLNLSNYGEKGITVPLLKRVTEGMKILKSVEAINLSYNNLNDSYIDVICDLFAIDNLTRIDISHNLLTKSSIKKLSTVIKNTNKLEYLDLSFNPFNTDESSCNTIITAVKSHLNIFHFGICDSTKDSAIRLLQFKKDIRSLNLEDSRYKLKTFEYLSKVLTDKRVCLGALSLRYTTIDFLSSLQFEKVLMLNKSLVYLNLNNTGLCDVSGSRFIEALTFNKTLTDFNLGGNNLGTNFCRNLCKFLKVNSILLSIDLSKNYKLSNESFAFILEGLVENQNFVSLGDLSDLKIGVKMRESVEKILNINKSIVTEGYDIAMRSSNTKQKFEFMKSSIEINSDNKGVDLRSDHDYKLNTDNNEEINNTNLFKIEF